MSQFGPQGEPIRISDTSEEKRESRVQEPVTLATGAEAPLPIHEPSIPPMQRASAVTSSARPGDAAVTNDDTGTVKPEPHDASNEAPPEPTIEDGDLVEANLALGDRLTKVKALVTKWSDEAETTPIRSERNRGQREMLLACSDELSKVLGLP